MRHKRRRRICFVTGTRAEFGLMRSTLEAIRDHLALQLQIVVTGMHLDRSRGRSAKRIEAEGWKVDRVVPWPTATSTFDNARQTGLAMAGLAAAFRALKSDVVLLVGDRVEAFAAASAGHIAGCVVAHVHGGDRARGQVDDALRHAITKLAHLHFPATPQSAERIRKLGEDRWRIHRLGSPGLDHIDNIKRSPRAASVNEERVALVLLHPTDADERIELKRARVTLGAVRSIGFDRTVIVYPNTDPGAEGIVRCWRDHARHDDRVLVYPDLPRERFLALLRRAAVLVGNSSSGIIEAASFGTPVVDIGPRQLGRERSRNVTSVPWDDSAIRAALRKIWNNGRPRRFRGRNVYGSGGAGREIAAVLASFPLHDDRTRRKLIAY